MNDEINTLLKHQHNSGVYWSKSKIGTYSQTIKDVANDYYFFYFDGTHITDSKQFLLGFCQAVETPEPAMSADNLDMFLDDMRGIRHYHSPLVNTYIVFIDNMSRFAMQNRSLFDELITIFGFATLAWYDKASKKRLYILMTGDRTLKPELAVLEVPTS